MRILAALSLALLSVGCIGPQRALPDAYSAAADIDKWECPYCGKTSYNKEEIQDHMDRRH